jgi:quercetin dioxygenase-like cupin family protein
MAEQGVVYKPLHAAQVSVPEPGMRRQVLAFDPNLMLVRHHLERGWKGAKHKHPHSQLIYVVRGCIVLESDGQTIEMDAGDSAVVGGNVEHQATALEDSEVLDVFTPYREDYTTH